MIGTWSPDQVRLVMLEQSGIAVRPSENVRGYDVHDSANTRVGEVADLVVDPDGRVRLLRVGFGGVFGIGREYRLVPVDVVESVVSGTVFLSATKSRVESAPVWGDISGESFLTEVYRHFDGQPFWSEGYRAPDWTSTPA